MDGRPSREDMRVAVHEAICDRRASHDESLGRCVEVADDILAALPSEPPSDPERLANLIVTMARDARRIDPDTIGVDADDWIYLRALAAHLNEPTP